MPEKPTILFHTSAARLFRTTLIGYLYELAKDYSLQLHELEKESLFAGIPCISSFPSKRRRLP